MITLLITGVGGPLGQALIKAARRSAIRCRIVGTDRAPLSVGFAWVDCARLLPSSDRRDDYLAAMERLCTEESVSLVLPASDSELVLLAAHAEALRNTTGATAVVASPEVLRIGMDKWETSVFLERAGLRFPRSCRLDGNGCVDHFVAENGFPLIAKPRRGSGSHGVSRVLDQEDLRHVRAAGRDMIVQEYLHDDDEEYTVAVYTQRDGGQAGSICLKRELMAGNTYRAWVAPNPAVQAEAEAIVRALGVRGPCNVQLRMAPRGPVAFEINPRFSGTTAMRAHFGYNEVEMAIRDFALGQSIAPPTVSPGIALRFWDELYVGPGGLRNLVHSPGRVAGAREGAPQLRVLGTGEAAEWQALLDRCSGHDFYHAPGYHAVAEAQGEGVARLFVFEEEDHLLLLPLLLREIEGSGGLWDATSVYGYAGPLASSAALPEDVLERFRAALQKRLAAERVVAVFSRLHPLFPQPALLAGVGECRRCGHTVSIDLALSPAQQMSRYSATFRHRIRRLLEGNVVCERDAERRHLPEFVAIYHETMRRVDAHESYFFTAEYFEQLAAALGDRLQLFVAKLDGRIIGAGLFVECRGIVQYHLGGARDDARQHSPMALILDAVRRWGTEIGARVFHLGGGVGAREDSLFRFKAKFSDRLHEFCTWRWIVAPQAYAKLCAEKEAANARAGLASVANDFFPAYRAPAVRQPPARIYLSPPHMGSEELALVAEAFATNWIAPLGPHVDAFEKEVAAYVGAGHAAALSSGTAAIHLALRLLGTQPGDEVLCSTFTFSASANPILYEGARPVFIDSEPGSWNMDPALLAEELEACAARGKLPRAAIVVDLYGQSADYDLILAACARHGVPVIQDAAEALGATYQGRPCGTQGRLGVFSFNGNKIITTSGGGMLVSDDAELVERARFLATQARDPAPHYQHSALGFNYRMSNVLAGIGRGQLRALPERIAARRRNFERYRQTLGSHPGIELMPRAAFGEPNCWLTCITVDPEKFGATSEAIRVALERENIESRPVWKPLHLQPVFAGCRVRGGAFSESVFERGLCLPSGSSLASTDLDRICAIVLGAAKTSSQPALCTAI